MAHCVTLLPTGAVAQIDDGERLGPALKRLGYPIKSGCAGEGYCSDCIVEITADETHLNPPTFDERRLIGSVFKAPRYRDDVALRLACQVLVSGSMVVDVSGHLEVETSRDTGR